MTYLQKLFLCYSEVLQLLYTNQISLILCKAHLWFHCDRFQPSILFSNTIAFLASSVAKNTGDIEEVKAMITTLFSVQLEFCIVKNWKAWCWRNYNKYHGMLKRSLVWIISWIIIIPIRSKEGCGLITDIISPFAFQKQNCKDMQESLRKLFD